MWRHHEEAEVDNNIRISEYTICSPSSSARRRNFRSRNSEKNLPSIQTTRTKASRTRVFLNRRRLLNHTSPTVGLLLHSHTFSHRTNDLVRDLELSKNKAELLGSRLKESNLFEKNVKISSFRSRHQPLAHFFRKEDDLVFCYDIDGLINAVGIKYDPQEWRLFIDSPKVSL